MTTTRLEVSPCPYCAAPHDSATSMSDDAPVPTPGDVGVCFYCAHIVVYDDELKLREPSEEEFGEMSRDPVVVRIVQAIQKENL